MATMTMISGSAIDIAEKLEYLQIPQVDSNVTSTPISEQNQHSACLHQNRKAAGSDSDNYQTECSVKHTLKIQPNSDNLVTLTNKCEEKSLEDERQNQRKENKFPPHNIGSAIMAVPPNEFSLSKPVSHVSSGNEHELALSDTASPSNFTSEAKPNNMKGYNILTNPYDSPLDSAPSSDFSMSPFNNASKMASPNTGTLGAVNARFLLYSAIGSWDYVKNSNSYADEKSNKIIPYYDPKLMARVLIPPLKVYDNLSSNSKRMEINQDNNIHFAQNKILTTVSDEHKSVNNSPDQNNVTPTENESTRHVSNLSQQLENDDKSFKKLQRSQPILKSPNVTSTDNTLKKHVSNLSQQLENDDKSFKKLQRSQPILKSSNLNKLETSYSVKSPKSPSLNKENDGVDARKLEKLHGNKSPSKKLSSKTNSRNLHMKSIDDPNLHTSKHKRGKKSKKTAKLSSQPAVIFCPSSDAYTPRINHKTKPLAFLPAAERTPQVIPTTMGTISRPNFRDALRRVAMILHQHIVKIERRFEGRNIDSTGLFLPEMRNEFKEDNFVKPRYKCTMVRVPMARAGAVYTLKKLKADYEVPSPDGTSSSSVRIPTEVEIYEFAHKLFKKVQLSSECSIVCLIYIERLMEVAKVPLMACTWRPILLAGLLMASKVWQDLSSWNIEFAIVYPQFSLESINKLEMQFLRKTKWDLYISSSLYAKYYFALRSLLEKKTFRQRYNRMVGGVGSVHASDALKIQKRTEKVKEEALLQLSRSM